MDIWRLQYLRNENRFEIKRIKSLDGNHKVGDIDPGSHWIGVYVKAESKIEAIKVGAEMLCNWMREQGKDMERAKKALLDEEKEKVKRERKGG